MNDREKYLEYYNNFKALHQKIMKNLFSQQYIINDQNNLQYLNSLIKLFNDKEYNKIILNLKKLSNEQIQDILFAYIPTTGNDLISSILEEIEENEKSYKFIKELLNFNINYNIINPNTEQINLIGKCIKYNKNLFLDLFKEKVDINLVTKFYELPPLHLATETKNKTGFDWLIKNGANVNQSYNYNYPILYNVIADNTKDDLNYHFYKELVPLVDLNLQSIHGRTALSIACSHGKINIAKDLINRGADYNLNEFDWNEEQKGKTILESAIFGKNKELINLISSLIEDKKHNDKFNHNNYKI